MARKKASTGKKIGYTLLGLVAGGVVGRLAMAGIGSMQSTDPLKQDVNNNLAWAGQGISFAVWLAGGIAGYRYAKTGKLLK